MSDTWRNVVIIIAASWPVLAIITALYVGAMFADYRHDQQHGATDSTDPSKHRFQKRQTGEEG